MALSTSPFKANGTTLAYLLAPAVTYKGLGELASFDPGGTDIASIEINRLLSVAFEKIASIPDNGDLSLSVYLVPGETSGTNLQLFNWSQNPITIPWQIQLPDGTPPVAPATGPNTGTIIAFNAFLSAYKMKGFETGSTPSVDITLTISGGITMNPGT